MIKYNEQLPPELNLLNALIHIKENIDEMPNCGICLIIQRWASKIEHHSWRRQINHTLETEIASWPLIAKCARGKAIEHWPVDGAYQYMIQQGEKRLWQNPRRLELLDYLIDQLSK